MLRNSENMAYIVKTISFQESLQPNAIININNKAWICREKYNCRTVTNYLNWNPKSGSWIKKTRTYIRKCLKVSSQECFSVKVRVNVNPYQVTKNSNTPFDRSLFKEFTTTFCLGISFVRWEKILKIHSYRKIIFTINSTIFLLDI